MSLASACVMLNTTTDSTALLYCCTLDIFVMIAVAEMSLHSGFVLQDWPDNGKLGNLLRPGMISKYII